MTPVFLVSQHLWRPRGGLRSRTQCGRCQWPVWRRGGGYRIERRGEINGGI